MALLNTIIGVGRGGTVMLGFNGSFGLPTESHLSSESGISHMENRASADGVVVVSWSEKKSFWCF